MCASGVRSVSHANALTYTTEKGKVLVRDQRVSFLLVSFLLGLSVYLSPILKFVPYSTLFGVFLYMGIVTLTGTQLYQRLCLIFVPKSQHPNVKYVQNVPTWKMHVYTFIQCVGLAILWAVKSSPASLFFPFFIVAMIPLRLSLKFFYSPTELEAVSIDIFEHTVMFPKIFI